MHGKRISCTAIISHENAGRYVQCLSRASRTNQTNKVLKKLSSKITNFTRIFDSHTRARTQVFLTIFL